MLVISRKKTQKIIIAGDVEITILEVGRNRVRFGIKAPKHIAIQTNVKDTPTVEPATPVASIRPIEEVEVDLPLAVGMSRRR